MTEALSRDFRERERERESIQNHRYMQAYESSRCVFVCVCRLLVRSFAKLDASLRLAECERAWTCADMSAHTDIISIKQHAGMHPTKWNQWENIPCA